ncbi:MAG: phosphate signaling complex protein PhoU [Dokdonella sp.]|uniref:phosphate signaling complex protein PhoU n=1 Tax=Dokdonella sp. TaxID=2291710 RepID=UPI003265C0F0
MDRLHLSQHISRQFNNEIEDVRRQVLAMGGLVEEQIAAAMHVLIERDAGAGAQIREREQQVNAAELAIDEQCAFILARRQPAASDLRLVLAVMKMLGDLERIGDEAKRIARIGERLLDDEGGVDVTASLGDLGRCSRDMLRGALDAFARLDEHLALDVMKRDRKLDALYKELNATLVARMQQKPEQIPVELDRLWCARSFERIGDRCKNLCEFVLYLLRGKDVRHSGLAKAGESPA